MMDNDEIGQVVSREISDALSHHDSEYASDRIKALDYYLGEPLGNEIEGKSQVISTEVADTVEQIMPSLMRIFCGSDKYVRFAPRNAEDVEAAEQVSDYVNYIISHDNDGYRIIDNWLRDSLLFKLGVLKFYYDDTTTVEEAEYENLTPPELALLLANPDVEVVEQAENITEVMNEMGMLEPVTESYDLRVKIQKKSGKVRIENVPPEEFLFNRRAKTLDDARFICHRTSMSVSDLVSMGYDIDEIEEHAGYTQVENEEERDVRFGDLGESTETDPADESQRQVAVYESIVLVDADGDGISERRRVLSIGDAGEHVLENEITDHIPFAVISPILQSHRLVGRSIFDLTKDLQVIKSTLMRQYLDATYLTVNPRTVAVENQVNIDDLLDSTAGGIVRVRNAGAVQMLGGTGVGSEVQPLMRYMDEVKEARTGMSKASQGLDANSLQSTTAAAVSATVKGASVKLESYARTIAETGMKDLFKGILLLITKYQQAERIVRLRNKFVPVDPREFDSEFDVVVNVGLGTADDEQKIAFLQAIAAKQEQILQQLGPNNPLCSMEQYAATLREIAEIGGFKDSGKFFNDPTQIAQLKQQAAANQQPQPNPEIVKAQQDYELKKMKIEAEIALAREKMEAELQIRREELALESQLRAAKAMTDAEISTNLPRV